MKLGMKFGRVMKFRHVLFHSFLVASLATQVLYGQAVTGSLLGTVIDSSGAVVPDATIDIAEMNTNITRSASTNASGYYAFPGLEPGVYQIRVTQEGFSTAVRNGVQVLVNSTVRVEFQLQVGAVSETLNITAEAPLLQTDRADTGGQIVTRQLSDMPLLMNRNYQGLVGLVPGAARPRRVHSEFFNPQDSLVSNVHGQSRYANNFQLEGVDNTYGPGTLTILVPSAEALATVDVTTSNYEAELGRAGGAVTNVTLKSGTNELHGSAFAFNRVDATQALNVFATDKAHTVYNQFGFTIGGPIRRNRTFFFAAYQGTRDLRGNLNITNVPSVPFRGGDLTASTTTIYDPTTGDPDGRNRLPFADKVIPASLISPISASILDLLPLPTAGGQLSNFQNTTVRTKPSDSVDAKVDHQFNQDNNLSIRYNTMRSRISQPNVYGLAGGPSQAGSASNFPKSAGITYSRIFSPTFLANFRMGFSRYMSVARNADYGSTISNDLGIPGINHDEHSGGMTQIRIGGYGQVTGTQAALPWRRGETNFNWVTNWTKIVQNHTIKWGADIRRARRDLFIGVFDPRARWNFEAGPTARNGDSRTSFANSFASFLLDQPGSAIRDVLVRWTNFRSTWIFSYVQDKWQVSPKLTLDLGLRHELYPPYTPSQPGGFSNYVPTNNTLVQAGIGDNPMNMGRKLYWTHFGPRLGASYRLNEKTVFRGGYGVSVTPVIALDDAGWAFNYPVLPFQTLTAPNTYTAAGSLKTGYQPLELVEIPSDGVIRDAPDYRYLVVPQDLKEASLHSWNFAFQRSLPMNFVFEVAYVGNRGVGTQYEMELNAGQIPGAGAAGQPLNQLFGRRSETRGFVFLDTSYHSLQVKFDRRFSNGLMLTTAYTYSKNIDYAQDNGDLFNNIDIETNRGRANLDNKHRFVQSYIYELPFGRNRRWLQSGVGRWVLGDWQVNGVLTAQSGTPLNLTFSSATLNAPGNGNRPNVSGKPEIFGNVGSGEKWFDVTKFSAPATATFGNTGRNILNGPGFVNLDLSVFRKFPITERFTLEMRAESFNFTNTPHFNNPNTTFGASTFGEVRTAVQDQRQWQFGLKLAF